MVLQFPNNENRNQVNVNSRQSSTVTSKPLEPTSWIHDQDSLTLFASYMNPRGIMLSQVCPQLNAASLFGTQEYIKIGYPDVHPSVSMWGHSTYITGWVVIGEETAIYPGCNFNGDAAMPLVIGKRCSMQHVELHYSGFRMLPTIIGDDTFMSHLAFGHSARIGCRCYILGHATIYDGAEVGDDVFIEGNSTILGNARLKTGWAYKGTVDINTPPMCRTSEVIFGTDPKTGEILYVGGDNGIAAKVNASHLNRNRDQMRLVALKNGYPEKREPAYAITIAHVFQTASHYLSLATQICDQLAHSGSESANIGPTENYEALAQTCCDLCACICTIYDGQSPDARAKRAWQNRTMLVANIVTLLEQINSPMFIDIPPLKNKVIQEQTDLQTMARKLREFETVMQHQEEKCTLFYIQRNKL